MMNMSLSATNEVLRLTTNLTDSNSSLPTSIGTTRETSRYQTSQTISDLKAMEHTTLKVPYEILNKRFRAAQKNIDREVSHVQTAVTDLEKYLQGQTAPPTTIGLITEALSNVVDKLKVLKRKAEESIADELDAAEVCKKRLDHLKEYCTKSSSDAVIQQWKKKRLDRMLVDHFLRSGYYDSAVKLALHSEIENLTNIDLFLVSREVEESLANHETSRCLTWCYDNKSKLRKIKSTLEFNLRQQEFIELVRQKRLLDAVKHAKKYFSAFEEAQKGDFQHVMGLLAFRPDTNIEPYKSYFDVSRWNSLIDQFRSENFKLYQLSQTSVFSVTLQAGLSALKTPQCYKKNGERNSDCPVCSDLLNKLATSLPCAHCSQSRLVCYISGEPLNEHNQPLVLPNGNVYGENALRNMARENNGKIICPRTKEVFEMKDAEKVYVM